MAILGAESFVKGNHMASAWLIGLSCLRLCLCLQEAGDEDGRLTLRRFITANVANREAFQQFSCKYEFWCGVMGPKDRDPELARKNEICKVPCRWLVDGSTQLQEMNADSGTLIRNSRNVMPKFVDVEPRTTITPCNVYTVLVAGEHVLTKCYLMGTWRLSLVANEVPELQVTPFNPGFMGNLEERNPLKLVLKASEDGPLVFPVQRALDNGLIRFDCGPKDKGVTRFWFEVQPPHLVRRIEIHRPTRPGFAVEYDKYLQPAGGKAWFPFQVRELYVWGEQYTLVKEISVEEVKLGRPEPFELELPAGARFLMGGTIGYGTFEKPRTITPIDLPKLHAELEEFRKKREGNPPPRPPGRRPPGQGRAAGHWFDGKSLAVIGMTGSALGIWLLRRRGGAESAL